MRSSARDEHRPVLAVLLGLVGFGLILRFIPRRFDVVHTFEHRNGLMAPTCGLTRAGLSVLDGDPGRAWTYNPAIFLVALIAIALAARLVARAASGRWLSVDLDVGRHGRVVLAFFAFILWVNQQAHFDLLVR